MSPRQVATDDATKRNALQLAEQHGVAEAARLTGVPAGTIRSWRHRAGTSGPPSGADPVGWAAGKAAGAATAWKAALGALEEVPKLLKAGKDPQRAAITFCALADKALGLERAVAEMEERQMRLDKQTAEQLVAVLAIFCDGAGIPFTPCKPLLAAILRMAEAGAPLSAPAPEAITAREAIRRRVRAELAAERAESHGLPQAPEPREQLEPEPEVEVLTGEVVDDAPPVSPRRPGPPREPPSMIVRRSPRADFSRRGY